MMYWKSDAGWAEWRTAWELRDDETQALCCWLRSTAPGVWYADFYAKGAWLPNQAANRQGCSEDEAKRWAETLTRLAQAHGAS